MLGWFYRSKIAHELNSSRGEIWLRSAFYPNLKAIYLPNPKVAGSTIMSTLVSADGSPHLAFIDRHNSPTSRKTMSAEHDLRAFWRALHDPSYFCFTFVRSPYARIVSCFLEKIDSGHHVRFKKMLGFKMEESATLLAFLRRVSEQDTVIMNRHWRPQAALISPKVKLDFIGRFEQFDDDFAKVLERLGVDRIAVREKRAHQTSANEYLDLIGPEEKAIIDRIYQEDFERFGYPKKL